MNIRSVITLLFFTLSFSASLPAQKNLRSDESDEQESRITRWNYGINVGIYHANGYTANFYNGSPENDNSVNFVMSNKYWYQEIKTLLGAADTVIVREYPMNMHYNVAVLAGLFVRYNFNRNYGICLDANYTQLKTESSVTFEVDPQSYTFDDIRLIPVRGIERRAHLDLMVQRNFWLRSRIYFYLQGGLNLNYTRVAKSSIYVEEKEYSMVNIYGSQGYNPNSQQVYPVIQGGIGYGAVLGGGVGIPLVEYLGIEPGGFVNYHNVHLEGYPKFRVSFGFYLRILLGNILPVSEEEE